MAERHDEDVAMPWPRRVEGLDWRDTVSHAVIVNQRRVQRFGEREAAERCTARIEHRRRATDDVLAAHQQHEHEVHAVAMDSLWRRVTRHSGACFDAELM